MNWRTLYCVCTLAVSSTQAALVGNWNQDELFGSIFDLSGNHPEGVATGTPDYGLPGVPNGTYGALSVTSASGRAIQYGPSTVDEYFLIDTDNDNPIMNIDATGSFTMMAWMNPAALDPSLTLGGTYRYLSTGSGAALGRGWGIGLRLNNAAGTASTIRFTTYGIADNNSTPFDVTFGSWLHVAATYSNGAISYFLNGNPMGGSTSVFGNELTDARLLIGGRVGGNNVDQMSGLLDGIRLYNTVLTQPEIQQAAVDSVSVVPEPSAWLLALGASVGVAVRRRRHH